MRPEALARLGLSVLVTILILLGLIASGGPGAGRLEKRDQTRLSDLRSLGSYVICVANARDQTLPDSLAPVEVCRRTMRREDPFGGVPYRYEKLSPTAFRLCADFEDPARMNTGWGNDLNRETGCIDFTYTP